MIPMAKPTHHPHFIQVINEPHQLQQLFIPKMFVMDYGQLLSNGRSCLRVPTSNVNMYVELIKKDIGGEVHFGRGWVKFCRHFSMALGNFLVFRYLGGNDFDVVILNKSGTEIDYRKDEVQQMETIDLCLDDNISEEPDDDGVEELDDDKYVESLQISSDTTKMGRRCCTDPKTDDGGPTLVKKGRGRPPISRLTQPSGKKGKGIAKTAADTVSIPLTDNGHGSSSGGGGKLRRIKFHKVMQEWAKYCGIQHPFFPVRMSPAYVSRSNYVHIPNSHADIYLRNMCRQRKKVLLRVKNQEKSWEVNCRVDKKGQNFRFESGWPMFVKETGITSEDICIFELVDPRAMVYMVHMIHPF